MNNLSREVIDYLKSNGINPFWLFVLFGLLGLWIEGGKIQGWKSLTSSERQFHRALIIGDIVFLVGGLVYVFFK